LQYTIQFFDVLLTVPLLRLYYSVFRKWKFYNSICCTWSVAKYE